ncbi:precorrin-3B synthase [Devosia aquimaris]|uniref:precorrin-3B synthase n=1 Tax=Devosia aquimaris TaxID=2866214 RepID=UPI001CD093C6|nr:precorrin-3B synthase [Devosia sp. CJK-A8-3]
MAQSPAPIAPTRRGACPSLDVPMATGDGLLARLRVAGGRMTPQQLAGIAALAAQHGNGLIEISARGNLQVRGLTPATAGPFAQAVEKLVGTERGLVVEVPPLAGEDASEIADPRPLAAAIRNAALPLAGQLGPKVTVIVDGRGQIGLAQSKADVRLEAVAPDSWAVSIGGRASGVRSAADAVAATQDCLEALAERGVAARASDLPPPAAIGARVAASTQNADPMRTFALVDGTPVRRVALAYGSGDHFSLAALAQAAAEHGVRQFRLAPQHSLLAIGVSESFVALARGLGFVTDSGDPRRRISACIGSAGCASGLVPARETADRLAPGLPENLYLHVSGCSKGCAHPRRADVTLVGQSGGYGLVIAGSAGDTPQALLAADQLESALATAGQG